MDSVFAKEIIVAHLKENFGRLTELREISVERSSSGRLWVGSVYCVTGIGDVFIGNVKVSEDGQICIGLSPDEFIKALTSTDRADAAYCENRQEEQSFSLFEDDELELEQSEGADIDSFLSEYDSSVLMSNIIGLLASGTKEDLLKARHLMPQLLVDHKSRGEVLRRMGELEFRLGETQLGIEYLEAAACEFADLGNLDMLKQTANIAQKYAADFPNNVSSIKRLLAQTLHKLVPINSLTEAPAFRGFDEKVRIYIETLAKEECFEAGTIILEEGAPALNAYVIKSGILGISLETPGGERRTVRCCFPGELVGESCIQAGGATCNATVFAKEPSVLWKFEGESLKIAALKIQDLRSRLEASRAIHRLDSFFSMNEITSTLDVRVRDRLIGCVNAIRYVREGEILERNQTVPSSVYLVLGGTIEYRKEGMSPRIYKADDFVCLRDTLHKLPLEGDMVVTESGRVITFETESLFSFAAAAPAEVVAVLERLE